MLAKLYVERLFKLQPKDSDRENLMVELIDSTRMKLIAFLEEKKSYDPSELLKEIQDSWMKEEMILLLVQEKKYQEAISIYVNEREFAEAELFCRKKASLGLMNTRLNIYFENYKKFNQQANPKS